jgi:hypothetical protein
MSFQTDRDIGNSIERLVLDLCHIQGIQAQLNPTPDPALAPDEQIRKEWWEGRAAYDINIMGYYCDLKWDRASYRFRNFCIEENGLKHTRSQFYIYALPKPASISFYAISVSTLRELYESGNWPVKIIGEQRDNRGVHPPVAVLEKEGVNFYQFVQQLKRAA